MRIFNSELNTLNNKKNTAILIDCGVRFGEDSWTRTSDPLHVKHNFDHQNSAECPNLLDLLWRRLVVYYLCYQHGYQQKHT